MELCHEAPSTHTSQIVMTCPNVQNAQLFVSRNTNDMHQPFDFPCNCCQLLLVFSYSFSIAHLAWPGVVVQTWSICFLNDSLDVYFKKGED